MLLACDCRVELSGMQATVRFPKEAPDVCEPLRVEGEHVLPLVAELPRLALAAEHVLELGARGPAVAAVDRLEGARDLPPRHEALRLVGADDVLEDDCRAPRLLEDRRGLELHRVGPSDQNGEGREAIAEEALRSRTQLPGHDGGAED